MINPRDLPVYKSKEEILKALQYNQVIVVESPTGSGKTTQIPIILMEAGYAYKGIIGITQPRRIATLGVCSYIKTQIEGQGYPENYCAYKMRFYDTTDSSTHIKILTDGMLLQEMKTDPYLSKYSVILVDEAHERSLNIDFILGLLKGLIKVRKDLKVLISSATLNTKVFAKFFEDENKNDAPIISIKTRVFDVDVKYFPIKSVGNITDLCTSIVQVLYKLLKDFKETNYTKNKDTLVFLPGEMEIKAVMESLYSELDYNRLQIYPLYGRLRKEEQELVFTPTEEGKMKVVLATNIAETSLTIDGIEVVIDSGLAKINYYNQKDFTSALVLRPISRSSAEQRKGRAGRTAPGICYRLYSKEDFSKRPLWTQEEILRTDLSEIVLRMVDLGIKDFESFNYITNPGKEAIASGEETLLLLNAIDKERNLTETGKIMVSYPLLPRHSRCVVEALYKHQNYIKGVIIAISFLSCKSPFVLPPGLEDVARSAHRAFSSDLGDFVSYQYLFNKYEALDTIKKRENFCQQYYLDIQTMDEIVHVVNQLVEITVELGYFVNSSIPPKGEEFAHKLLLCLGKGLIQYICVSKKPFIYRTITTNEVYIHPGSAWFRTPPQYLLAGEICNTSKMYARTVSPMKESWINEISPYLLKKLSKLSVNDRNSYEDKPRRIENKQWNVNSTKIKTISIYGQTFPILTTENKKGTKNIAIIDYKTLPSLARAYNKASRHPKGIIGTIAFNNGFIHFGDKLHDLIALNGRIDFNENSIVESHCSKIFEENNLNDLIPYLGQIMKLSPMKDKTKWAFIELVSSGNCVFFHLCPSFDQALNNSAYTLLSICDVNNNKAFRKAYNNVVALLG